MSAEVDWVLAQLQSVADAQPADHPLERVDRDESNFLEGNIRKREGDLQRKNFVGATLADRTPTPTGGEFGQRIEAIVGVRIEGLHVDQWGHIDPSGADAVKFDDDGGLVDQIQNALNQERDFPDAGGSDTQYHTLFVENDAPQSSQWRDYFRYDFDVRFVGRETLPDT